MMEEIGKISLYMAKDGNDFLSVLDEKKIPKEGDNFKIREFSVGEAKVKFLCKQTFSESAENPPWLNFVNSKIGHQDKKIFFPTSSLRPSGILLINIKDKILAATFGMNCTGWLKKSKFRFDFGIKVAMNMCGNKEIRQTKSSTHSATTKNIDRQISKPSDSFTFGLSDAEFLQYLSAHMENNKNFTLQGKDSLTIKVLGDEKPSWEKLIELCVTFIAQYDSDKYKTLFPNYPNFEEVSDEIAAILNDQLIHNLKSGDFSTAHLAVPEFIADDEYSFTYTNYKKRDNLVLSHIEISDFSNKRLFDISKLDITQLENNFIYAYSHDEEKILSYKKWTQYSCIISEIAMHDNYYVLSGGRWRKVDGDFFSSINLFIENSINEEEVLEDYKNINISNMERGQNREEVFNSIYVSKNKSSIKFDQAKLKIGNSSKDKEFCDILEFHENLPMSIIHVKRFEGASSLSYLFSQANFYCEFFISDEVFLNEIRGHINNSESLIKDKFLNHIKENLRDVHGKDFSIKLWVLYDNKKPKPSKSNLPLMVKYELKLAYERLQNICKYNSVILSMIPVQIINFSSPKKPSSRKL